MNSVPSGTPAPGLDHEAALLGVLLQRPELALRLPTRDGRCAARRQARLRPEIRE